MRRSIKSHCEERHQAWPARARYARQVAQQSFDQRWLKANEDVQAVGVLSGKPWLEMENGDELNVVTGEIRNRAEDQRLTQEEEERQRSGQDPLPGALPAEDKNGPE